MKVFIIHRPSEGGILGVYSTEEYATLAKDACYGKGCDVEIQEETVDEDVSELVGVDV